MERFFGEEFLQQKARIQLSIAERLQDNLSIDIRDFENGFCQSCHNTHRWTNPELSE
mgnify:CR=1 FL=1